MTGRVIAGLMEKDFETVLLLDIYARLLTEKQQGLCDMYYNQDYSLAEIADLEHTTRQAVRDGIDKARRKLRHFEQCLALCTKRQQTLDATSKARGGQIKDLCDEIERIWDSGI